MNALKTGIDAKWELLRFEIPQEHANLMAEYYDRFQPATPEERFLVDRMISSEWLHRRYSAVEGGVWERECSNLEEPSLPLVYLRKSDQLARIERRLNSAQRNFDRAHKELRVTQEKRRTQPPPVEANTEIAPGTTPETKPLNPELGSFLISGDDRPSQAPINEIEPLQTPSTPPNTQNKEPDLPLAA